MCAANKPNYSLGSLLLENRKLTHLDMVEFIALYA